MTNHLGSFYTESYSALDSMKLNSSLPFTASIAAVVGSLVLSVGVLHAVDTTQGAANRIDLGCGVVYMGVTQCLAAEAPADSRAPEPPIYEVYPWSESSDSIRVTKSLLNSINLMAVGKVTYSIMGFGLTPAFIEAFRVTEHEATQVNNSLAAAMRQYRMEEAKHMERVDASKDLGLLPMWKPPTVEEVRFKLSPFPKEAAAIHLATVDHTQSPEPFSVNR